MKVIQLTLAIVLSVFSNIAISCSCANSPISEKIGAAESVIEGVVIKAELLRSNSFQRSVKYTFEIDKTYKGKVGKKYSVYTASDSASCGTSFAIGKKYVVLVYENDQVGSCGGQEEWYDKKYSDRVDLYQIGLLKELRKQSHNQ